LQAGRNLGSLNLCKRPTGKRFPLNVEVPLSGLVCTEARDVALGLDISVGNIAKAELDCRGFVAELGTIRAGIAA
jgi:hypothetical protein